MINNYILCILEFVYITGDSAMYVYSNYASLCVSLSMLVYNYANVACVFTDFYEIIIILSK